MKLKLEIFLAFHNLVIEMKVIVKNFVESCRGRLDSAQTTSKVPAIELANSLASTATYRSRPLECEKVFRTSIFLVAKSKEDFHTTGFTEPGNFLKQWQVNWCPLFM